MAIQIILDTHGGSDKVSHEIFCCYKHWFQMSLGKHSCIREQD